MSMEITDPVMFSFKQKILEKFSRDVKKVFLYGSRARGDFEPESDYDVIVLVKKISKKLEEEICTLAWEFGFEHHVSVSVLVFEQKLFETDLYEPLFINIRREGVILL